MSGRSGLDAVDAVDALGAVDAIVLAGGRGSRLGGASKARLTVGGRRLVDRVTDAAAEVGARRVVVAGPDAGSARDVDLRHVVDDPPFGGPLAGLAAALPETDAPVVLLLACDLPFADEALRGLLAALEAAPGADGAVLHDAEGRAQWLLGAYRREAIAAGIERLGDVRDLPARALLEPLTLVAVPATGHAALDVDRWRDLARASVLAGVGSAVAPPSRPHPSTTPGGPAVAESTNAPLPPEALDDWVAALAERLGLRRDDVPVGAVLDLARDVAHGVARPAAPLSTFIVGLAAGRSGDLEGATRIAAELAAEWAER
ncbi:NTP transferase domain-containing protein [Agromyces sp. CFH 90414]|uniref:NTP transferase domain-containing protein n=1 Tax=Agromyces agglutinans TaxID=2662258 RepID=A0A6I2F938_9MICO|nr:NTP transferase domain-containing protein [Agromyces agglutinans]MRG61149.1 NTP transferase domain-containing protein [Agromyces agglutinans]